MEFRLRTENPYKTTKNWSRLNNFGRFWFLPNGKENDFFQRLKYEQIKINKNSANYQKINSVLRNKEVARKLDI